MAMVTRFEDVRAWQEARKLVKMIYQLTNSGRLAEGFDCESKAEFARFLGFARRSAVEVQSLLYTAFDVQYITETELREHYEQTRVTKALIGGFKHSLKK